jgi:hypothetical protein
LSSVVFVGIDPPAIRQGHKPDAMKGVSAAEDDWTHDPHGRGQVLAGKRARRNPWDVWQGVWPRGVKEDVRRRADLVTDRGEGEEVMNVEALRPWAAPSPDP